MPRSPVPSKTTIALLLLRFNVSLQIAVTAIVVNLILTTFTFYYGTNALYCAFGADCVIGVLTALILIWRFASSKQKTISPASERIYLLDPRHNNNNNNNIISIQQDPLTQLMNSAKFDLFDSTIVNHDDDDHARELWSTFWLGQVMILSGFSVIVRTIVEIFSDSHEEPPTTTIFDLIQWFRAPSASIMEPLYTLALISLILNTVLMFFKIFVYYYLNSNSMLIEGVNSLISSIFALTTMFSIRYSDAVKGLDETVSLLFGMFFIVYGSFNVITTFNMTVYKPAVKKTEYQLIV